MSKYDKWFEIFSKHVENLRDKQESFESNVIESVRSSRIFEEKHKSFIERLWKSRNEAAHPTNVAVTAPLAEDFITSGVTLFLANKALLGAQGIDLILEQLESLDLFPTEYEQHDKTVAKDLLKVVLHKDAYFLLARSIITKLCDEPSPRFRSNGIQFLRSMALMQTAESDAALIVALFKSRTPNVNESWMLEVIEDAPRILTNASGAGRRALDVSLAAM